MQKMIQKSVNRDKKELCRRENRFNPDGHRALGYSHETHQ